MIKWLIAVNTTIIIVHTSLQMWLFKLAKASRSCGHALHTLTKCTVAVCSLNLLGITSHF